MKKMIRFVILLLLMTNFEHLIAQTPTLYVVTRSTKRFRIANEKNPTVGLFSTNDRGKNWRHYGWQYTKCFSVSAAKIDGKKVFYLSCGNGVHVSKDGGKIWKIATGWKITECLKTAVDPVNPEIVYAATAYGIFKTVDGGETWVEKNLGLISTFTPAVIVDRSDHRCLFCATEAGIHFSQDGGEHWKPIGLLGLGIRTIVQHPANPDIIAVGTEDDGVFISFDHGKSWQQKVNGLTHRTVYALAFSPHNTRVIYAGTFQGGIFKSTDMGRNWSPANKNLRILDIHALVVDPTDEQTVYAGILNDGVWLSENGGKSWRFIGLETSQVWDMIMF